MKAWAALGMIVFCNLQPGLYTGTCDGEPVEYEVGADGTLGVVCQSVSVALVQTGIELAPFPWPLTRIPLWW